MLTDAGHVLVDLLAVLVSIITAYLVNRKDEKNVRKTGAYINLFLLTLMVFWILYEATERLYNPVFIHGPVMLAVSFFGMIGNYFQLKIIKNISNKTITSKLADIHVFSDLLQSFAVVVSSIFVWASGVNMIDTILSFAIALWMSSWIYKLFVSIKSEKYLVSHCGYEVCSHIHNHGCEHGCNNHNHKH